MSLVRTVGFIAVLLCVAAGPAAAQTPLTLPPGSPTLPDAPEQARRGPITITPFISVTGEYNDNIFQNNANKVSDFILGFTPGVSIAVENPIYRLLGSYSFTAEIYADNEQLNDAFARQDLRLSGSYRVTPLLTLGLTESFTVANNSNFASADNVSTGRTRSTSNTLSPSVTYQYDPRTSLRFTGAWTMLRYDNNGGLDSDTYSGEIGVNYAFTSRLTGITGYQISYFDIDQSVDTVTHTPRVGASYRFTPTLTGTLTAGPTFVVPDSGDSTVTASVAASLQQRFSWGGAALQYDRSVGTAGGLGGTTVNQSVGATVQVDRLVRGLVLQFVPRYTNSTSTQGNAVDIDTFSVTLQARYEFTRYVAGIAGYTFYAQRSNSSVAAGAGAVAANDVDQNRLFVGVQFGYPITID